MDVRISFVETVPRVAVDDAVNVFLVSLSHVAVSTTGKGVYHYTR